MNKNVIKNIIQYGLTTFIYFLILSSIGVFGESLKNIIIPILLFSSKWCLIIGILLFTFFIEIRIKQAIELNTKKKDEAKNKLITEKKENLELINDKKKMKKYKFNQDNI